MKFDILKHNADVKTLSDDAETQTMAVLVLRNGQTIRASNTLPSQCRSDRSRTTRPHKYEWIEHSERNAIYYAARNGMSTLDATMYIEWYPCADCARAIVQAGVSQLVCGPLPSEDGRYSFSVAHTILAEGGVEITERSQE